MKKIISLIVAFAALTVFLFACNGGNKPAKDVSYKSSGESTITSQPMELCIHFHVWGNVVYRDDWTAFKKASELTNIKLKGIASPSYTDSNQAFDIMMASGEIPDIVVMYKDKANAYGEKGKFIDLTNLIDKYAPNYKSFLARYPDMKKHITAPNGKIYFISYIQDGKANSGYFIRKDWLDLLGLQIPKTVDEYYKVLKAFKEQDPNKNGEKDEVPYFASDSNESYRIINLYGARSGWYVDNGKVKYGPNEDVYKSGISNLSKWYQEGLIDKEIFTRGKKSRDVLLGNNTGGATHGWFSSTASYNDKLKDKIENFNFIAIPPPADVNGKVWEESRRSMYSDICWGISSNNNNPVETIKYFDFWFSETGRRLANFGVEGIHYDLVDGKPLFKNEIINGEEAFTTILNRDGVQVPFGYQQDFTYEEQTMNNIAKDGVKLYIESKFFVPEFPMLTFTKEENDILEEKWAPINTYVSETRQKWVLGAESVDSSFGKYKSRLKDMGMNEVIAIYQKAYDRFIKN